MKKNILCIIFELFSSILFAQQTNDVLAVIKNDSLFVYNVTDRLFSFIDVLPKYEYWRFYKTQYNGETTKIWLYGMSGEITISLSNDLQSHIIDIDTVSRFNSHICLGIYYSDCYGNILNKVDNKNDYFIISHTNRKLRRNNKYLSSRICSDTISLINKPIPKNCWEEYTVCDLSLDSSKILILYGIVKGKQYRIKPIGCEIDIKTKQISKIEGVKGLNAKYSPSGNYFLYWKNWIFGEETSVGYYFHDLLTNKETYLPDIQDATWINRNADIVNSEKTIFYMY